MNSPPILGAPPILEPILVGLGMFTGGYGPGLTHGDVGSPSHRAARTYSGNACAHADSLHLSRTAQRKDAGFSSSSGLQRSPFAPPGPAPSLCDWLVSDLAGRPQIPWLSCGFPSSKCITFSPTVSFGQGVPFGAERFGVLFSPAS